MRIVLIAAILYGLFTSTTLADVRILASPGGNVGAFVTLFAAMRASGERVIIDGPCLSACTLVLSALPRDRICVTGRAVLGFHAPYLQDAGRVVREPEWAEIMLETYPAPVRRWVARHGGLSSNVLLLRGRDLTSMFPVCRSEKARSPHRTRSS
jgi:hypothetical protein